MKKYTTNKPNTTVPPAKIYPETMTDDIYDLDEVNTILDKIYHEDHNKNNS